MKAFKLAATLILGALAAIVSYAAREGSSAPESSGRPVPPISASPLPNPAAPPAQMTFKESRECQGCHSEIFKEWQQDQHATAWTGTEYRLFTVNYSRVECYACHAPNPILEVGLTETPQVREAARETGVDCIACHVKDGRAHGWRGNTMAPCAGVAAPELKTSQACYHCHSAHNLFKEYLASPQYREGKTCQDCHMAAVNRAVAEGSPLRATRRHLFHAGGHDREALAKVLAVDLAVRNDELAVTVTNAGAAHGVPGEINNRVIRMTVSVLTPAVPPESVPGGWVEIAAQEFIFRAPPRFARDKIPSTQILSGEPRVLKIDLPQGTHGRATATLTYRLEADVPNSEVFPMIEKTIEF